MSYVVSRLIDRRRVLIPVLLVLFVLSFAGPLYFLSQFLEPGLRPSEASTDSVFPESFLVERANQFLAVPGQMELEPNATEDFLFVTWIKPHELPGPGERVTFASKMESAHLQKRGYSLSLLREGTRILPLIWWQDGGGNGDIHRFAPVAVAPDTWLMLALSFDDGKLLGLHGASLIPGVAPKLRLLGGYEIDGKVLPRSAADLLLGAKGVSTFRGRIGPTLIYRGDLNVDHLPSILESLVTSPLQIPDELDGGGLLYYSHGGPEDLSSYAREVGVYGAKRLKKGKKKKARKGKKHAARGDSADLPPDRAEPLSSKSGKTQ